MRQAVGRPSWGRALAALAVFGLAVMGLAGCVQPQVATAPTPVKHALALAQVAYSDLPGWQQDHPAEALPGFLATCRALAAAPPEQRLGGQGDAAVRGGSAAQWRPACDAAATVQKGSDAAARSFFEAYLQPYAISDTAEPVATRAQGLYTGYFDPEVTGSRSSGGQYRTPLLGRPGDLVQVDLGEFTDDLKGRAIAGRVQDGRLTPYYDRSQIEGGVLARRRLELVWLAGAIDAFVLQIQGSGRVDLPGGNVIRVSYAGQNGRPYVPIGRILADRGQIPLDQVSMQTIRAWLVDHPEQAAEVMNQNPSFVFFREVSDLRPDQGPPGALGVPLTPGRSVAVDRAYIPLGAPLFIATTDPLTGVPLQRLMLAQDLGGAIRGPVRADIFFGWGQQAEARAGQMRQHGTEYLLLPRPQAVAAATR
jgi:membrane-bound lytic murein transglycosylase A